MALLFACSMDSAIINHLGTCFSDLIFYFVFLGRFHNKKIFFVLNVMREKSIGRTSTSRLMHCVLEWAFCSWHKNSRISVWWPHVDFSSTLFHTYKTFQISCLGGNLLFSVFYDGFCMFYPAQMRIIFEIIKFRFR